jgi:hypothetical protein
MRKVLLTLVFLTLVVSPARAVTPDEPQISPCTAQADAFKGMFPKSTTFAFSPASMFPSCASCEAEMQEIRGYYWNPNNPYMVVESGGWCAGTKAAVTWCWNNCAPCQVCVSWYEDYKAVCEQQ